MVTYSKKERLDITVEFSCHYTTCCYVEIPVWAFVKAQSRLENPVKYNGAISKIEDVKWDSRLCLESTQN